MGSSSITIRPLFDSNFGSIIWHPSILTDFSAAGGAASLTFKSYKKAISFSDTLSSSDVYLNNDGFGNIDFRIYQGGNLAESFKIRDFEDGLEITGLASTNANGGISIGEDTENSDYTISTTVNGTNTVQIGVVYTGNIFSFNSNISVKYFLESLYFTDETINLRNGVTIRGMDGSDSLRGFDTNDETGQAYNDTLLGFSGNDYLYAGEGDDVLAGGPDNDSLNGELGNDTYLFSLGNGSDTVYEEGSDTGDKLLFDSSIGLNDFRFVRSGNDLYLYMSDGGSIRLYQQFDDKLDGVDDKGEVENLQLSDGTIISLLNDLTFKGTSGNDSITGLNDNNTIIGLAGNDYLYGEGGNDTYIYSKGEGSDYISESGADTGDRILFDSNISVSDFRFKRSSDDLYIKFKNGSEIRLSQQFDDKLDGEDDNGEVEFLELSDGTNIDLLNNIKFEGDSSNNSVSGLNDANELYGYAGADTLRGYEGDDILVGGTGNDSLYGGLGNDKYLFAEGEGLDYISESGSDTGDRILFDSNISVSDFRFKRSSDDLYIKFKNGSEMRLSKQFDDKLDGVDDNGEVEFLALSDGTNIDLLNNIKFEGDFSNNSVYGLNDANELYGYAGADTLRGYEGDDILVGGTGNDSLYGGLGNDKYLFAEGEGLDYISESGSDTGDRILFDSNISVSDFRFKRSSDDLYIKFKNGSEMRLSKQFDDKLDGVDDNGEVEFLALSDGTNIDLLNNIKFEGDSSNNNVSGLNDANELYGYAGADTLRGYQDDDILVGGTGNDNLYGGLGNDKYLFSAGEGLDTITEIGGDIEDVLSFDRQISLSDIRFERQSDDLYIYIKDGSRILIRDQFEDLLDGVDDKGEVETLKLDSGTVVNLLQNLTFTGNALGNTLYGINDDNVLVGLEGNDNLYGEGGTDTAKFFGNYANFIITDQGTYTSVEDTVGNEGIDRLYSIESIQFADGVLNNGVFTANNAPVAVDDSFEIGTTLPTGSVITNDSDADVGQTLIATLQSDAQNGFLQIANNGTFVYQPDVDFSGVDNFTYTLTDGIATSTANVTLTVYNQILSSSSDDVLVGTSGYDHYFYEGGDDTIDDYNGQDILFLQPSDIAPTDITFLRMTEQDVEQHYHMILDINGYGSVKVHNQFDAGDTNAIELLRFNDGSEFSFSDIQITSIGSNAGETIEGISFGANVNDIIRAGGGDDSIVAGLGDDDIMGEDGDDIIIGGSGDDIIHGGSGLDYLMGDDGADTFLFTDGSTFDAMDVVFDFSPLQGDTFDIQDLLVGYTDGVDTPTDYVAVVEYGVHSVLFVDPDGGADGFQAVAALLNTTGLSESDFLL